MPLSFVRHFPTVFATTAKESYIRKEQSGKGGKGGKKKNGKKEKESRKEGKRKNRERNEKEEKGGKSKTGKMKRAKKRRTEKSRESKKRRRNEKRQEEWTKKAVNSSEHAPAAGRYKKTSPVKGRMKENGLLQRRNVKLRNFAATHLPWGTKFSCHETPPA